MREIFILTTLVFLISPATKGQDGNAHDPFKNQTPKKESGFIIVEKKPEYPRRGR